MPQIAQAGAIYASQLFWLAIVFALIYIVIGRAMVPRIEATMDDRAAQIAADLAAAEAARATMRTAELSYDSSVDGARGRALKLVGEAKVRSAASTEAALKAGAADQERALAEATSRIDATKRDAFCQIEAATIDAAEDIVAKLSGVAVDRGAIAARVKAELAHV